MLILPPDIDILVDLKKNTEKYKKFINEIINKEEKGKSLAHVVKRGKERGETSLLELLEVIEEINQYLPDDWRMTKYGKNDFAIMIVDGSKTIKLVGSGIKYNSDKTLNIIRTVLEKQHFSTNCLKAAGIGKDERITTTQKIEESDLIAPNLYFFRSGPDNFTSPLFARQYEKIGKNAKDEKTGDEYHRIHPLTKSGLDLEHFIWIRWNYTGDVKCVESVPPNYHGKDFWEINNKDSLYALTYVDAYETLKKKHSVASKYTKIHKPPYEIEYKFLIPGSQNDADGLFNLIEEFIGEKFELKKDRKTARQVDIYFDYDDFALHVIGASFRLREKKDSATVTFKKRKSISSKSDEGLYERIEEEAYISKKQKEALLKGERINLLPFRLIDYIIPPDRKNANDDIIKFGPKVKVINERSRLSIRDSKNDEAEISFDRVTYEVETGKVGPYFEVEIESKGMAKDDVSNFAKTIQETLGLISSSLSKYERGISLLKTQKTCKKDTKKLVIIDTDCGVDDALALILALKSPELEVMAVTAVSGNVHIDKVVPNIFKVFEALGLDNIPLVARGADKPLKKVFEDVPSVHGTDGLGDVSAIAEPAHKALDSRPAWQLICDLAKKHPKEITLITIGPLTNLALAIQNDSEAVKCLKEVVAMGGVFFNAGNIRPDAEFNVYSDPEAACEAVEFCKASCVNIPQKKDGSLNRSGEVPLTFVGLDVTHQVMLRRHALKRMAEGNPEKKLLEFICGITEKYMDFYEGNEGIKGCYLHDPLAIAYVINPSFLEVEKHIIRVETRGQFTSGVIFPDDRPTRNPEWRNPKEAVIGIAHGVEREAFEEFFIRRLME